MQWLQLIQGQWIILVLELSWFWIQEFLKEFTIAVLATAKAPDRGPATIQKSRGTDDVGVNWSVTELYIDSVIRITTLSSDDVYIYM